jgi:hypothetical protein
VDGNVQFDAVLFGFDMYTAVFLKMLTTKSHSITTPQACADVNHISEILMCSARPSRDEHGLIGSGPFRKPTALLRYNELDSFCRVGVHVLEFLGPLEQPAHGLQIVVGLARRLSASVEALQHLLALWSRR